MKKEKRENKAKQTLSKEELAKLQRRELLAEKLKAKRAKENILILIKLYMIKNNKHEKII
jgi:hypothetical protein